jgi:hypothetical protein
MLFGSRPSETRLRRMAARRIIQQWLPVIFPAIIRPQHGSDAKCEVCGQRIDRYRIEYQVTDTRDGYELAFHLLCYRAWQVECRFLLAPALSGAPAYAGAVSRRSSSRPW